MFASLLESIERQRTTADEAARALRSGASEGQVFDLLLPLARMSRPREGRMHRDNLLPMFGQIAMHQLVNSTRDEQVVWFEQYAERSTFRLRKP